MKKIFSLSLAMTAMLAVHATDYYYAGEANGWSNNNESFKFVEVDGVLTLEVADLYGEFKVTENGDWHPQHGAAAAGEGVALNTPYTLVKGIDTPDNPYADAPANAAILMPGNARFEKLRYKDAKLTLDVTNPDAIVINLVAGEVRYINVDGVGGYEEEVFLTKGPHTIYSWYNYDQYSAYKDVCTRKNPWKKGDPIWYGPIAELGSYGQMIADVDGYYQIFYFGSQHESKFIVIYPDISGTCGENLTWAFDTVSGNLAIYGSGTMTSHPWENIRHAIKSVTLPPALTSICDSAFYNCSLTSITCEATTPPTIGEYAFNRGSYSIPVYVPCGTVSAYNVAGGWSSFYNIQEPLAEYSIQVSASNNLMGTAQVDKLNACGCNISATANYGYHFVQWSDGNTDNPRSLELTKDTVLTAEFAPNNYTLSIQSDNSERGTTSGDITTTYLDYVTISATANYGYHFSHWNDYNYDNPRQVQVTEDKTYIAYFDKNTYYITKNYDSNQGYVDGYSSGEYLDNITLTAEANYGYHFVQWSDGNTDNPRHFILTQDTTFSAEFAQTFSGQCGDNLYWSYQNSTLTISGFGEMYNERPWGLFTNEIQTVVLPNGITHIGNDAFSDCTGLNEITIPYTVTSIGDYAFAGCRKLVHVNCYAINPPMAETTSFANYNVYLNVPCDNLQDYQLDMVFGSFKYIQCMEADSENVPTDDVVVTPGTNDVTITWPTAENANTYTIIIQKGNEVFCTLTFNADGQLLNIAFAPGRNGNHPAQFATKTTNGLRFTVTGLEESTNYTYDIISKDENNESIETYSGEFKTQSNTPTDVGNLDASTSNVRKLLRNGHLIIVRDGVEYNTMGQEM